jgi:membrane protease subunit HflK
MEESTYKLIRNIVVSVVSVICTTILFFNTFYTLKPGEEAVITTFGQAQIVDKTGPHLKIPFIQSNKKVDVSTKGFPIGYEEDEEETAIPLESLMITKDMSFVNVDFYIEYEISDAIKYLYNSDEPLTILHALAMSNIRDTIGLHEIDDVITTGKAVIQGEIQDKLMSQVNDADIGIRIVRVSMQDSGPPNEKVQDAFKSVENARQAQETAMYTAQQYHNETYPAAEAQADQIIKQAEAIETTRANEAVEQITLFNQQFEEYQKHPELVKERMYWEAMERLMVAKDVVITGGDSDTLQLLPIGE